MKSKEEEFLKSKGINHVDIAAVQRNYGFKGLCDLLQEYKSLTKQPKKELDVEGFKTQLYYLIKNTEKFDENQANVFRDIIFTMCEQYAQQFKQNSEQQDSDKEVSDEEIANKIEELIALIYRDNNISVSDILKMMVVFLNNK